MTNYLIRRFLLIIPTLLGITILTFTLTRLAGNPADMRGQGGSNGGKPMTDEARKEMTIQYGWDKPTYEAYFLWLGKLATLNLGTSFDDHQSVLVKIEERLPVTIVLNFASVIVLYGSAVPIGVYCAIKRGQFMDRSVSFFLFGLYSIPTFVMAMFLILFVSGGDYLNLLPLYGLHSVDAPEMSPIGWFLDMAKHMILPVICLSYIGMASLSRYARSGFLEVINQDYVRTARAKGAPESTVLFRHAFRNTLIPLVTLITGELPGLIGGSIIVENIYSLPGMGQLTIQSLFSLDQPVIMGVVVLTACLTLLANLLADIVYTFVDPRVRYS